MINKRYMVRGKRADNGEWVIGYLIHEYYIMSPKASLEKKAK